MIITGKIRMVDIDKQVFCIRNETKDIKVKYLRVFEKPIKSRLLNAAETTIIIDKKKNLIRIVVNIPA